MLQAARKKEAIWKRGYTSLNTESREPCGSLNSIEKARSLINPKGRRTTIDYGFIVSILVRFLARFD